ncbi:MAG: HlyD family efflux transporter periplasmic adaptor subunit [Lentisphaeria bacterium]|nr:HlyD family efflux transporter periplasmic adaptor subunit [Lentisphaeria bacterium]
MAKLTHRQSGFRAKLKIFIILTVIGVCTILALGLSLLIFEIEDTIYCDGIIVPDKTFEIVGHVEAHVIKFNNRIGDDVKKGDIIAELDTRVYESNAIALEAAIRELEAEQELKKVELAILEKEPLPKDLWYAKTNLQERTEIVKVSRERLDRSKKLQMVSAISKVEFEKVELEAIQHEAELKRAEENYRRVQSGLGQKYIEKAKKDLALVAAKLKGKKEELAFIRNRISECKLVAPADGRLVELGCKDTWYVARGKVAAVIAAGKRIRAIAKIDARVIRKVKPKQPARVTSDVYNKYQYGNFKGIVKWIGDIPLDSAPNDPIVRYPAEIELDPEGFTLKYGSGVEIAIITGKQPAIFSLLNMSDEDFEYNRRKRAAYQKAVADEKMHLEKIGSRNQE